MNKKNPDLCTKITMSITDEQVSAWNEEFKNAGPQEILRHFLSLFKGRIAFASSLGAEDQVLTEMIAAIDPAARIFTLDTGRLFPETYDLIAATDSRYGIRMEIFFPDRGAVEAMVREKGINLFYESIENRKSCCHIRKVEPLQRALEECDAWITGLRKAQSVTRSGLKVADWDVIPGLININKKLIKINPLANWTEEMVWEYIHSRHIPYHPLHDQQYPSIGCQPCTRAVKPGDDIRSGRWWWENPENRECGLHRD